MDELLQNAMEYWDEMFDLEKADELASICREKKIGQVSAYYHLHRKERREESCGLRRGVEY